jgi:site-specific DNA-methyltransferase (adenine-specific)
VTWEIRQGDALKRLREMPDESVQCCVTSPPYWGLRDYGVDGQLGLEKTPELYVAALLEVFTEVHRVLRSDGTLWLNLGDSYSNIGKWGGSSSGKHARALHGSHQTSSRAHGGKIPGLKPKELIGIPWMAAFALREASWYLRAENIWHKPNAMTESVRDRTSRAHEHLFHLTKAPHYFYDYDSVAEPAIQGGVRNKRSVWEIHTRHFPGAHFAVFPVALVEPCILASSSTGDTVLDPFAGAGTTGLVANRLNRDFIGIELNPEYVELGRRRIRDDAPLLNTPAEVAA